MLAEAPIPFDRKLLVTPGENLRMGQGKKYLMTKTRYMGPHNKIQAIATGIIERDSKPGAFVLAQAGDAAGVGVSEANQVTDYLLDRFDLIPQKIFLDTDSYDTSTIAENAARFVRNSEIAEEPIDEVDLVTPSFHARRVKGQMEGFGLKIDNVYISDRVYVNDPHITESTRKRRQKIVHKLYRYNPYMYLERVREFGLNVLGLVDPKGMIVRKRTSRSRNNA